MKIDETLPWKFTGGFKALDGDYFIGTITSDTIGAIVSLSHDGNPNSEAMLNEAGKFIVESVNAMKKLKINTSDAKINNNQGD